MNTSTPPTIHTLETYLRRLKDMAHTGTAENMAAVANGLQRVAEVIDPILNSRNATQAENDALILLLSHLEQLETQLAASNTEARNQMGGIMQRIKARKSYGGRG